MNFDTLNSTIVRSFLKQLLRNKKFKRITPPVYLKNKYYFSDKYAFYLGIDAIIKYDQIIGEDTYLNDYVNQLVNIFNKYKNYDDIKNGISSLLVKIVSHKLELINPMSFSSREKILYYIYSKYIVNGYFYFGFSSNYINEIECVGIRKNTFFIDDKLEKINDEFKKNTGKLIFLNDKTTITDDFIIASYFAFLSPYYLADMAVNPLFKNIDKECFYTHNINEITGGLIKVCDTYVSNPNIKKEVVNNFIDCYTLSCKRGIKPCIAKISRKSINKDRLKDIEEIIKNKELNLTEAVRLIVDSRYNSYNIKNVISPFDIEIIKIPTYQEFQIGTKPNAISVNVNSNEFSTKEVCVKKNIKSNSFGAISLAYIGLLFIFVGTILAVFISFFGG